MMETREISKRQFTSNSVHELVTSSTSPKHQTEDVKGRRLDDTPLWSGDLDRLLELIQEAESLPSHLPPQNTEAQMARQDAGYGSPRADRNPQHPRHAEVSVTEMEQSSGKNGRRATTQTTFFRDVATGTRLQGGHKRRCKDTLKKSLKQLQINPAT
ncbi:unnamed protein product [Schistocephalus solidus]|uniref:Uncharacterized protein n=1 Tax=Schistocephalus solidus TaxID=70667 RepID=A0A183T1V7_SCHSO|nr:unnamed protein product [Schistocephalus solidus]